MASVAKLKAVKRKHAASLLRQPGVCGVNIDTKESGEGVLQIHLDTRDPKVRASLPEQLDGFPVEYVYTGPIRKLS